VKGFAIGKGKEKEKGKQLLLCGMARKKFREKNVL